MLASAVTGRENTDDFVRSGNGFRRQHGDVRPLVAVVDHLPRPVRVHRPEVMIRNLFPVDVFPPHIDNLSVGKNPGRVVLLDVARQRANIGAVGVTFVNRPDLRQPAVDPAFGACGTEDNRIVRQVRRLVVVPAWGREIAVAATAGGGRTVFRRRRRDDPVRQRQRGVFSNAGNLFQTRSVNVDFVQTVMLFPGRQVGKEDFLPVVMNLRVANVSPGIGENGSDLFRFDVVNANRPAGVHREWQPADVVSVIADVGVPVRVVTGLAENEENLFRHAGASKLRQKRLDSLLIKRLRLFSQADVIVKNQTAVAKRDRNNVDALFHRPGGNDDDVVLIHPDSCKLLPRVFKLGELDRPNHRRRRPVGFDDDLRRFQTVTNADNQVQILIVVPIGGKLDFSGKLPEPGFRLVR